MKQTNFSGHQRTSALVSATYFGLRIRSLDPSVSVRNREEWQPKETTNSSEPGLPEIMFVEDARTDWFQKECSLVQYLCPGLGTGRPADPLFEWT